MPDKDNMTNFSKQVASIQLSETGGGEKHAIRELSKDDLMTPKPFDRSNMMMLEATPLMHHSKNTPEKFKQKSRLSNMKQSSLKKSRPN